MAQHQEGGYLLQRQQSVTSHARISLPDTNESATTSLHLPYRLKLQHSENAIDSTLGALKRRLDHNLAAEEEKHVKWVDAVSSNIDNVVLDRQLMDRGNLECDVWGTTRGAMRGERRVSAHAHFGTANKLGMMAGGSQLRQKALMAASKAELLFRGFQIRSRLLSTNSGGRN